MTPNNQVVVVYNFLPNTFNLTSSMNFMNSLWCNTDNSSEILNNPIYNGTMYQFALTPNNSYKYIIRCL